MMIIDTIVSGIGKTIVLPNLFSMKDQHNHQTQDQESYHENYKIHTTRGSYRRCNMVGTPPVFKIFN